MQSQPIIQSIPNTNNQALPRWAMPGLNPYFRLLFLWVLPLVGILIGAQILPGTQRSSPAAGDSLAQPYQLYEQERGRLYRAANPVQNWQVQFASAGVQLKPQLTAGSLAAPRWSWGLHLAAYGYPDAMQAVEGPPIVTTDQNTLTYQWNENLQEWYQHGAGGLEQGFTLATPPPGDEHGEPLQIDMTLSGTLTPWLADHQTVFFTDEQNQPILRYDKLLVLDAAGTPVPAHLELLPAGDATPPILRIVVEDAGARYPLLVDPLITTQIAQIVPDEANANDGVGWAVDVDGDTAVIGAIWDDEMGQNTGATYVFTRTASSETWVQVAKLTVTETVHEGWFGYSVAVSGDTIVVGVPLLDTDGNSAGAAFVFSRHAGGLNNWGQVTRLSGSNTDAYDRFGHSVAIEDDTIIVGAYGGQTGSRFAGAAYVFARNQGGPDNWGEVTQLYPTGSSWYWFGRAVAISGDTVVVGSTRDSTRGDFAGAIFVFERHQGGPDNWGQVVKRVGNDTNSDDLLGEAVAIQNDTIVAGAPTTANSGAVYIFERHQGGNENWGQVAKVVAGDIAPSDRFGGSVAIAGNLVVAGANLDDNERGSDAGAAYVFARHEGGFNNWGQAAKLIALQGIPDGHLGRSVSIEADIVIAGAPYNYGLVNISGAVYAFRLTAVPDLHLTQTASSSLPQPGQSLTYTLAYSNTGLVQATGVILTETVPFQASFNPAASTPGWGCAPDHDAGSICTLDVGGVPSYTGGIATFVVTLTHPLTAGVTAITNTASIGDDGLHGPDYNPADNDSQLVTPIDAQPDLQLAKTDGGVDFLPGETIIYSLTYTNAGNQSAAGVILTETVPAYTTFTPAASDPGWLCTPDNGAGSVCSLAAGFLAGASGDDAAVFAVTVDDPAPGVTEIVNTAVIADDGRGGPDANPTDNTAGETTPLRPLPPGLGHISITSPISESGMATLTGAIQDINPGDSFTLTVGWGDGGSQAFTYPPGTAVFTETHPYLDDDPSGTAGDIYAVDLVLADSAGLIVTGSTTITVTNLPPLIANLSAPPPLAENEVLTVTGSLLDLGLMDSFTLTVDWADGSVETFSYPANAQVATPFTLTHQYQDDALIQRLLLGEFAVNLAVVDDDLGLDTAVLTVTVDNVAPTLSNVSFTSVNENETTILTGQISDPGSQDSFSLLVDWGDGMVEMFNYGPGTAVFTETHLFRDDDPTGTPLDVVTATLTLVDDNGGTDTAALTTTVSNVPPQLSDLWSSSPIVENGTLTLTGSIVDPGPLDSFVLAVDWADGLTETVTYPADGRTFTLTHRYLDDGLLPLTPAGELAITLALADDDLGTDTAVLTVTVANAAPTLWVEALAPIHENETATLTGQISDPGPLDSFTLLVAWGDGSSDLYMYGPGTTVFTETHVYLDDDPSGTLSDEYPLTLTLMDDDGGMDSSVMTITVANLPPQVEAGSDQVVAVDTAVQFVGVFTDAGSLDTHTITWAFGDGSSVTGTLTPTHLFALPGIYTVTLTVSDDDGGIAYDEVMVTVESVDNKIFLPLIVRN